MKRSEMPLPMIRGFGCVSLRTGCIILCFASTLACIANITIGAWQLPQHRSRDPEDNLISLSMVMFTSLSAIADIVAIIGVILRRPGNLQLSLLSNCVFILCIFLVAVVTCVFRLEHFIKLPWEASVPLVMFMFLAGFAYSGFYLMVLNSYYRMIKLDSSESAIPI